MCNAEVFNLSIIQDGTTAYVEKLCRTGKIQIDGFEENGSCYYFHFDNE
jgi:hypothetical protein